MAWFSFSFIIVPLLFPFPIRMLGSKAGWCYYLKRDVPKGPSSIEKTEEEDDVEVVAIESSLPPSPQVCISIYHLAS